MKSTCKLDSNAQKNDDSKKKVKCVVYWLDDKLVSIVSSSAVVDIPTSELVEGITTNVRFSDRKLYQARILKIGGKCTPLIHFYFKTWWLQNTYILLPSDVNV